MYLLAFAITYGLVRYRLYSEPRFSLSVIHVNDLTTGMIVGLIVGARLGYVLFYNLSYYMHHPLEIVLPFDFSDGIRFVGISGMSYHGGLIGVVLATVWYVRRMSLSFWEVVDLYAPVIPLGYTFGRLGNFINGELYGRVTDLPIGMYFPLAPDSHLRHPSQLYEAFFEGIVLFLLLFSLRKKITAPRGVMLPLYLAGYGTVRFCIEFVRQPDAHIGFVLFSLSMGQLLCMAMIAAGIGLYILLARKQAA